MHRLVAVHHRQAVQGKNSKTGFISHEAPNSFEGPPSDFWKFPETQIIEVF